MTNLVKDSIREIIYESLAKTFPSNHDLNDRSFQKQIEVSRSKDARFGDYATNVALILAKVHGLKPRDLAQTIAGNMNPDDSFVSGVGDSWSGIHQLQNVSRVLEKRNHQGTRKTEAVWS